MIKVSESVILTVSKTLHTRALNLTFIEISPHQVTRNVKQRHNGMSYFQPVTPHLLAFGFEALAFTPANQWRLHCLFSVPQLL